MNNEKSQIFSSKGCKDKTEISDILCIKEGCLPVKYLGLPLTSLSIKIKNCSALLDSIRTRIEGWDANC